MRGILLRESPDKLVVRMWLFPYLTWATIGMISFVLVYMLTDDAGRERVILSGLVAALVVAISVVRDRLRTGTRDDVTTDSVSPVGSVGSISKP